MCDTLLTLDEVLEATGGSLMENGADRNAFCFTSVVTDSRNVCEKSLFVPLIGEFQDGHAYIPQAMQKGASVVFVAESAYKGKEEECRCLSSKKDGLFFVIVKNTLTALQDIAEKYVSKFPSLIRVSITGSSGKTTTKEILASILRQKFNLVCNKGNLNSETGLPLSCFEIRKEHEAALLEMGMNRENEIGEIAKVFKPEYAGITNIGTAHVGMLGSRENIAREKKKIFTYIDSDGVCVIPYEDDFAAFLSEGVKGKVVYFGKGVSGNGIEFVKDDGINGTFFKIDGEEVHLKIPGKYNYNDTLLAVEIARKLGLTPSQIKKGIEDVKPLGGRSNIIRGKYTILEDCYNANPDSMEKSLEFAGDLSVSGKKIFVIGDMKELGEESCQAHRKAGQLAVKGGAQMIVFVGNEMVEGFTAAQKLSQNNRNLRLSYYEKYGDGDIKNIAAEISGFASEGDFILLKASHSVSLERLIPLLEEVKGQ